ncbi:ion channel [Phenylobacterium sp.]|jgi:inward rectifier potassium channel|uniref:ion channel n=1 Tax=Phenylobacterium sp. TaxID=1871053 RepID=UPI002E36FC98|nr:ion channel [Phenylobacterium sp.]HEX3364255.1 ion channel [Phenylobacterium sp.]
MKLPPPRIDLRGFSAVKLGVHRFSLADPYYFVLAMRWSTFLAVVLGVFLATNLLFAAVYWAVPGSISNARAGAFGDAFFFSIETLATVGYGVMTPATLYGHLVASTEIFVGMFLTALTTGAFFARFARPSARMVFSETAVVAPYGGGQALMVRVASRRLQGISEATARLNYYRNEAYGEGRFRRFDELKLVRTSIPVLTLTWTLIHVIDEESPLFGMTDERMAAEAPAVMLSISGFDEAISSLVNDRQTYRRENMRFGHVFVDMLRDLPDGMIELDLTRIHDTRPVAVLKEVRDLEIQESAVRAS